MKKTQPKLELPAELLGPWRHPELVTLSPKFKYYDRNFVLRSRWDLISKLIPEYLTPTVGKSVIDISAANGAMLEIMRHFGYEVFAVDFYKRHRYDTCLQSQGIPYLVHDCTIVPYPIPDKSYDILLNTGALTQYFSEVIAEQWLGVLNEFARIARELIVVALNTGWRAEQGKRILLEWKPYKFALMRTNNSTEFIWKRTK